MLVEDDEGIRRLSARYLAGQGYGVVQADSAEHALELLKHLDSPILLVDHALPRMTGIELVETLRNSRKDFEAVLFTAHADVDVLTRALTAGFFRCVHKPFRNEDLRLAVAGAANRLLLRLHLRAGKAELERRNTELERVVQELREAQQQRIAGERLASLGRLAAGVAHEINSPLAAVIANLALMEEEHERGAPSLHQLRDMLQDAREAAERVRTIVRDLRTFSRGEEDHVGAVDLRRTIDATINLVFNEIKHRARLVKDYGETKAVHANEGRLGQVVLNLLINAAQAIPEGDVGHNEIRIVTRDSGDRVLLEVRDTGEGMTPTVAERVFEPFFTTKPVGMGTGLGLSICHGIIKALGGEISVESSVGGGSVFRVYLPIAKSGSAAEAAPPSRTVTSSARILAIDDDDAIQRALKRVLHGHDIVIVGNGREALEVLSSGERFDVIVCDLMMPEVTGMELYDEVAARWPEATSTIIFLTGGTFTPAARAFLDRVPNPKLTKPFQPEELRAMVAERVAAKRSTG